MHMLADSPFPQAALVKSGELAKSLSACLRSLSLPGGRLRSFAHRESGHGAFLLALWRARVWMCRTARVIEF